VAKVGVSRFTSAHGENYREERDKKRERKNWKGNI